MKIELTTIIDDIPPYTVFKMFNRIVFYVPVKYFENKTLEEYLKECIDKIYELFSFMWTDLKAPIENKLQAVTNYGILGECWLKASTGIFEDGKVSLHLAYTENIFVFDYEAGSADAVIHEFMAAIAELKD